MIEAGFKNPDDERASSGTLFDTFLDEEKLEKREQETNSEFPVGSGAMKMITNNVSVDILAKLEAMPELKTKYIAGKKKQIASAYKKRGTDRWVDAAAALATTVVSGGFSLYKAFKGKGLTRTYASKQLGASNAPGSKSSKTSNGTKGSPVTRQQCSLAAEKMLTLTSQCQITQEEQRSSQASQMISSRCSRTSAQARSTTSSHQRTRAAHTSSR